MLFGQIRSAETANIPDKKAAIHRAVANATMGVPACGTPVYPQMMFMMFDCEVTGIGPSKRCGKPACKSNG
jgi:hypothetical protein